MMSLTVVVKSANDFSQGFFSIVVAYRGSEKRAECVCSSPNPVWNETLVFPPTTGNPLPEASDVLKVVIFRHKDQPIQVDSVVIPLREIVTSGQKLVDTRLNKMNARLQLEVYAHKDVDLLGLQGIPGFHSVYGKGAQELIAPHLDTDGYYLLRPTRNKQVFATLSVTHHSKQSKVIHYQLKKDENGQFSVVENKSFPSVQSLLRYYQTRPIRSRSSTEATLLHPILGSKERKCSLKHVNKLRQLMKDTKSTINLRYLKLYFAGLIGLGKTTFRKRLTGSLQNLMSLPPEERERCHNCLAECNQALAVSSDSKLILKVSTNLSEEIQLMFTYLSSFGEDVHSETLVPNLDSIELNGAQEKQPKNTVVDELFDDLQTVVASGDYTEELLAKTLLNLIDMGGVPGLLEMLPLLSRGPGVYLTFFPLDKDLDECYEVSFECDGDKTTPYKAEYTLRETLSQVLCAISHFVTIGSTLDPEIAGRVDHLRSLKPVVILVGTYQDRLEQQVKVELIQAKLEEDTTSGLPKSALEEAIAFVLKAQQQRELGTNDDKFILELEAFVSEQLTSDGSLCEVRKSLEEKPLSPVAEQEAGVSVKDLKTCVELKVLQERLTEKFPSLAKNDQKMAVQLVLQMKQAKKSLSLLESEVIRLTETADFSRDVEKCVTERMRAKHEEIASITSNFQQIVVPLAGDLQFFPVDNFKGTDADIDPIRKHLQEVIERFFEEASLPIRPAQLLFSVLLRKFDIVSLETCLEIGRVLKMDESEVRFTLWYLHQCVGTLIYCPEIRDKDGWFENHVICSPSIVFDSIRALIVKALPHPQGQRSCFTMSDLKYWTEMGQFSIAAVKRCHSDEDKKKVKEGHLIPLEKLVELLQHINLLAPISGSNLTRFYFMPTILQCGSKAELSKAQSVDANTPSPVKITFECGYVPVGAFCGVVSRLVSGGDGGVYGMKWSLLESGVRRNLVSFKVDSVEHNVTLIAHPHCYEVRVTRCHDSCIALYDLCSYVLTTVLCVLSEVLCDAKFRPIIAFDCHCQLHQGSERGGLCKLDGRPPCLRCEHGRVTLSRSQEHWCAKEVKSGEPTSLRALLYSDPPPNLGFKWTWNGQEIDWAETTSNSLKVERVRGSGYYTCEVSKNKQLLFKLYHRLKILDVLDAAVPGDGITLSAVREVTWEVRAQWNDLGIELGIDEGTRKSIRETNYNDTDKCFTALLEAWFKCTPSWSAIIQALRTAAIDRKDIASDIEKNFLKK